MGVGWVVGARGRSRWWLLVVGLAVAVVPGVVVVGRAGAVPESSAGVAVVESAYEPTGTGVVVADHGSASAAARRQGARVEVLAARTAASRAWALPEGGFVAEQFLGEVRFPDASALSSQGWRDIDTTLQRNADGTVSPRAVPDAVVLTGPLKLSPNGLGGFAGTVWVRACTNAQCSDASRFILKSS